MKLKGHNYNQDWGTETPKADKIMDSENDFR